VSLFRGAESNYLREHRLADVLALVQVLSLDEDAHRSETGLRTELQTAPRSAATWTDLATEHPEFFRVTPEGEHRVSLLARHVTKRVNDKHPVLEGGHVDSLLRAAIEMHDRQVRRSERWTYLVPIWVALVAGMFSVVAVLIKAGLKQGG
jgi:alpha-ketoglutarate-dependent taurine dioxygenase